jgi:energy-coupling factor transporter transmembrane protein EcfT
MSADKNELPETGEQRQGRIALEIVFISIVGLVVIAALITSLSYDFVSARAPIFIMVPLVLVIAIQFDRTRKRVEGHALTHQLTNAVTGENHNLNKAVKLAGLMIIMVILIFFAGHYIGISAFMFTMLYFVSGERPGLSLLVSVGVTALLFVLFEYGFGIELHRGYLFSALTF